MKTMRKLFLCILSMWFALTCFIDFIAVPTVFRSVSSRAEAGNIGMTLFTMINRVEFVFALLVLILAYFFRKTLKKSALVFLTLIGLVILTSVYNIHMTPKVVEQTKLMRELDEESQEYQRAQETHEFYHSLYKKTDGVKIIILLILISTTIIRKEDEVRV